ncbi:MAG: GIY-YIG nuclease family protein, partial [Rhodococcus qingshengii]
RNFHPAAKDQPVHFNPASATSIPATASRVRRWLTRTDLQDSTRRYLEALHAELQLRADDSMAKAVEDERAVQKTQLVESSDTPGIYVYTLPHYLRYPFEPESGRTLLKVGRSERDTFQRVNGQTRITALPEDPVLLRVYQVDPGTSSEIERDFHSWLDDANHDRSRSTRGGTEWFLTSVRFLDRIARSHKLAITVVNDVEMGEL